jgi:hypothetical protein
LFDLDVKARLTIHYGGVAAAFGLVFFVAGEMAEGLVAQRFLPAQMGQWAGLLAAGLLTLAIKPLEKASRRVAHKILPSAKAIHELNEAERHALYRDQFAMALQDGRLTESERKMLVQLQAKLGIQPKKSSVPRAANMKPRGVSGVKSKV